jgi:long-chain acyl-CoA synthetase
MENVGVLAHRLDCRATLNLLQRQASSGSTFVDWPDTSLRYATLLEDVRRCCSVFDQFQLRHGDRVLIATSDERAAVTSFVAALLDGLVPIVLTPESSVARLQSIADRTTPGLLIVDHHRAIGEQWTAKHPTLGVQSKTDAVAEFMTRLRRSKHDATSFQNVIATVTGREPCCDASPDDLAYILFTSGTTSAPKGVMITHDNLFRHLETISRVFSYDSTSCIFNGLVLAHGDGLVQGPLLALANGCRLIRPAPFSTPTLEQHLNMVRAKRATHFLSVPTVYSLIDRYAGHDDYFDADEFVALVSVAAKLDEGVWRRLEQRFRKPIYNMYGLTETVTGGLFAGPHPEMGPIGTIGKPIDIDVRLVRPDDTDAPDGEPGEIWLHGDNVFPGYFGDPAATAARFAGRWLKTGDTAARRADGAYEILGRSNTIIKYGGHLIRPEELDDALLSHPAVVEAASVGLADPDFGEIPASAVVLDANLDEIELTAHCARLLEPHKIPKRIFVVSTIPRGDAGKPKIEALRGTLDTLVREHQSDSHDSNLKNAILDIASKTFRVPVSELSLESSPKTISRWDSFAHINLILQVELRLSVHLPVTDIVNIDNLRKLVEIVRRLS